MDQTRKVLFGHCNAYDDYLRVCPFDVFARGPESTHLLLPPHPAWGLWACCIFGQVEHHILVSGLFGIVQIMFVAEFSMILKRSVRLSATKPRWWAWHVPLIPWGHYILKLDVLHINVSKLSLYYKSGFRIETMYNYYIVMKSMFLGCKTIIPPYFWLCKPHHYPPMNYTQTIPKTIQKPKVFFKNQNFNSYKLGIHLITLYKNEGVSQGHKHLLIY